LMDDPQGLRLLGIGVFGGMVLAVRFERAFLPMMFWILFLPFWTSSEV